MFNGGDRAGAGDRGGGGEWKVILPGRVLSYYRRLKMFLLLWNLNWFNPCFAILMRLVLCYYNQTNEYNLKIISVVRFPSWFLYIGIEQIVWIILMFISGNKKNFFTVFLVNSKIFCHLLFTVLQILHLVVSFSDSFFTVSDSIWSLSFG